MSKIKGMLQKDVNLAPYNTFGISAKADFFSVFNDVAELSKLLDQHNDKRLLVLGGGSNVLFKNDFKGLVLVNRIKGIEVVKEDSEHVYVKSGAGENWHEFVLYCIENGWGGVENLSLIPGSVGASPMQNIGAYGVEIKDVFQELEAYHIASGVIEKFNHEACEFGYRESVFKRRLKDEYIITSVTYKLSKKPQLNTSYGAINEALDSAGVKKATIKDVSDAVIAIRQSKLPDPKKIGNAGSFFKNPVISKEQLSDILKNHQNAPFYEIDENHVKIPAGWLIDTAGWKGKRYDNFGIHKNQALVLVNYGGANGDQLFDLSTRIIEDIKKRFNIQLEREVNIIT